MGVSEATYYNWKKKYGGLGVPELRRRVAQYLLYVYCISARRACRVICLQRASWAYKAHRWYDTVLRQRLRELAQVRVRYGSQRLYILLRREGWPDNHKRVHRLYCLEGLNLRSKRPRRNRAAAHRLERLPLSRFHQCWSMDFVADNLFDEQTKQNLRTQTGKCVSRIGVVNGKALG